MNTILPKFVDFNNKTAFKPIKHFYQNVDHHAFYMIGVLIFVILLVASIYKIILKKLPDDFLMDIINGGILAIAIILIHAMSSNIVVDIFFAIITMYPVRYLLIQINDEWKPLPKEPKLKATIICKSICKSGLTVIGAASVFLIVAMYFTDKDNYLNYQNDVSNYNTSGFKIANTNLMASRYESEQNHYIYDTTLNPMKNYHKSNYYVYVDLANPKPKQKDDGYVTCKTPINTQTMSPSQDENNSNRKMDIYYLGQMKNGHFIPNYKNVNVVYAFMDYQKYIKIHQLENKFKHHFSFEISYKHINDNKKSALIVVGDNGFNLHYANAKRLSYSKIVQSEK